MVCPRCNRDRADNCAFFLREQLANVGVLKLVLLRRLLCSVSGRASQHVSEPRRGAAPGQRNVPAIRPGVLVTATGTEGAGMRGGESAAESGSVSSAWRAPSGTEPPAYAPAPANVVTAAPACTLAAARSRRVSLA